MNLRWFVVATAMVVVSLAHVGSAAQQPPTGQPANPGPGQPAGKGPGQQRGPGQKPGQRPGPGQTMGQRPGPGQVMGQRPGPGKGPGRMGAPPVGAPGKGAVAVLPPPPPRVHRKGVDPFRIPWSLPPPPPYVFDDILPVRLAGPDIEPPVVKPITVREEPALRVSGIMTGDGVFAILEQAGDRVDIVKPGSSVDIGVSSGSRTYRVASIKDDTVTLESVEGNTTYQQIVPLSDAPIGTSAGSFGAGMGNAPGKTGMRPPMSGGGPGGFPGLRPGGGGGAADK